MDKSIGEAIGRLAQRKRPSFDEETGQALPFYYSFQRNTNIGSETLPLGGVGNPVNYGTGLIRSAFRPSDDATILQFFVPGNIHMYTELKRARKNFINNDNIPRDRLIVETVDSFIETLSVGIEKYGIINHPEFGKVYAYEVDGYGSATFMDDANIPSLLSIPDLGYKPVDDEVYQNTRKMILSKEGNPYYLKGYYFEGIGGPTLVLKCLANVAIDENPYYRRRRGNHEQFGIGNANNRPTRVDARIYKRQFKKRKRLHQTLVCMV